MAASKQHGFISTASTDLDDTLPSNICDDVFRVKVVKCLEILAIFMLGFMDRASKLGGLTAIEACTCSHLAVCFHQGHEGDDLRSLYMRSPIPTFVQLQLEENERVLAVPGEIKSVAFL